ncbi:MAG: S8 family serine peptidase, partial [Candidatus Zixiibacteriota bacterium]
ERPVVVEKRARIATEATQSYFDKHKPEKAKIWVFFTDKGVFDDRDFRDAAKKIALNEHALKRRAKVGKDRPVFADLPVRQEYVDQIIKRGAQVRRLSRWLNAASFEMELRLIGEIARLPFVYKIQPVAGFKSPIDVESPPQTRPPKFSPTEADALDYGSSWTQVSMINVPAMHSLGHTGEGVIVAMLDTGYRKSHDAFARASDDGRVLDEYDFIFNDGETQNEIDDDPAQHNHGTYCWSTLGGYAPGNVIGPAYGASFLLAKTEDVRSETQIEEDNWVAALEWADSLGADVISTSLSYSDWYTYEDFDGNTAVTTLAANTAAGLGIVVCNSIGNSGPGAGTLGAPSDAFDILACGAVDRYEVIAYFSSHGPTYDGRTKPEVCAMGVSTACADGGSDVYFTTKSGTSLSTPLVGGAAALLLSANPTLNSFQVRKALMETADRASNPGNTYGWGIIDVLQAYNWGANFTADTTLGIESLTVNFSDSSTPPATSWTWSFGDGDSSFIRNPMHTYSSPGSYDVALVIESAEVTLTRSKEGFITVIADTLSFVTVSGFAGDTVAMSVNLSNSQSLNNFIIPTSYANSWDLTLDRVTLGARSKNFDLISEIYRNDAAHELVFEMTADTSSGMPFLAPGSGEIARLFFVIDSSAGIGESATITAPQISGYDPELANARVGYAPIIVPGSVTVQTDMRGDADNSGEINIVDVSYIINYLYKDGPTPITLKAGDADSSQSINLLDVTYLINYLYKNGPPPEEK